MIMQKRMKLSMILFVSLIASITIATLPSHTVALTYAEVFDAEFMIYTPYPVTPCNLLV